MKRLREKIIAEILDKGDDLEYVFPVIREYIPQRYSLDLDKQQARFNVFKKNMLKGVLDAKEIELTGNKIRDSLIDQIEIWFKPKEISIEEQLSKFPFSNRILQLLSVLNESIVDDVRLFFYCFVSPMYVNEEEIERVIYSLTQPEKKLINDVKNKVRKAAPDFFKSLLSQTKKEQSPADIRRLLRGFYLCWKTIKKLYPSQDFMEQGGSKIFVELFRYRKTGNNNKVFDLSHQTFTASDFTSLRLNGEVFDNCTFFDTDFSFSILENVSFLNVTFLNEEDESDFIPMEENFGTAKFFRTELTSCKFEGCSGQKVNFEHSMLKKCTFSASSNDSDKRRTDLSELLGNSSQWENCNLSGAVFSDSSFKNSRFEAIQVNEETTLFEVDFEGADLSNFNKDYKRADLVAKIFSKARSLYKAKLSHDVKKAIILAAESPDTLRQLLLDKISLKALRDKDEEDTISEEWHHENFPDMDYIKSYQSITERDLNARQILHDWLLKKINTLEDRLALYPSLPNLSKPELVFFLDNLQSEIEEIKERYAEK